MLGPAESSCLPPASFTYDDLPTEMNQAIAECVSDESLASLLKVSKVFYSLITEVAHLRKRLFLYFAKPLLDKVENPDQKHELQKLFFKRELYLGRFEEATARLRTMIEDSKALKLDENEICALWLDLAKAAFNAQESDQGYQALEEAKTLAGMPKNPKTSYQLWLSIAQFEIKLGGEEKYYPSLAMAKNQARLIYTLYWSGVRLADIAVIEAKLGLTHEAEQTLVEAKMKAVEILQKQEMEEALIRIASAEVSIGWHTQARETVELLPEDAKKKIEEEIAKPKYPEPVLQPEPLENPFKISGDALTFFKLLATVPGLLSEKRVEEAKLALEQAGLILEGITKDYLYIDMLFRLADAYQTLGDFGIVKEIHENASDWVLQRDDLHMTMLYLIKLINKQIEGGWLQEAQINLSKAYKRIEQANIYEAEMYSQRLLELSKKVSTEEESTKSLNDADQKRIDVILNSSDEEFQKALALNQIADSQIERRAYAQARETLAHIANPTVRIEYLLEVINKANESKLHHEAIATARVVPTAFYRIKAMLAL